MCLSLKTMVAGSCANARVLTHSVPSCLILPPPPHFNPLPISNLSLPVVMWKVLSPLSKHFLSKGD